MDRFRYMIRPAAIFAGLIGAVQSALWIALSITGMVAYYCHMDLEERPNVLGSLLDLTFWKVYFNGPCEQPIPQDVDFTVLENLTLLEPVAVHGIIWAYLVLSFFWMIASVLMITSCRIEYIKYANIFIFTWIGLAGVLSILDLSFGILFGVDYGTFMDAAYEVPLNSEAIATTNVVLLAGQAAAGIMMGVAFRGFVLWIINIALVFFFFVQTFAITDFNKMNGSPGVNNPAFLHDKNETYGFNQPRSGQAPMWFPSQNDNNRPFRQRSFSQNSVFDDRRQRPMNANEFNQPTSRRREDDVVMRSNVVREINDRNSMTMNNTNMRRNEPNPDYSPPMPRTNNPYDSRPQNRAMLRSSRF